MEENNIGIYKITNNVNGKVYIGESVDLKKRESKYKGLHCKGQQKIYNSIKKYGWENFTFEVLEYCKIEDLKSLEYQYHKYYYDELGAIMLLNLRAGGGGGQSFISEETRKKLSDAKKGEKHHFFGKRGEGTPNFGKIYTDETRKNISESQKGEKCHNWGKKATKETKLKMSEAQKGLGTKKISQYTKDGEFIKHFNSIKEANEKLGIHIGNISQCLTGKIKTSGGFIWKYFEK